MGSVIARLPAFFTIVIESIFVFILGTTVRATDTPKMLEGAATQVSLEITIWDNVGAVWVVNVNRRRNTTGDWRYEIISVGWLWVVNVNGDLVRYRWWWGAAWTSTAE